MLGYRAGESRGLFVLRWSARSLSVFIAGLLPLLLAALGFDPSELSVRQWGAMLLFPFVVVSGMFVAWRREGLGGGITVAGLAAFYLYSLLLFGGMPRGPAYLLLSAPGFLFLLYDLIRRRAHAHSAATPH